MSKILLPDSNSWLIESLFNFFKLIKNNFNVSLYEGLSEFVSHYSEECAYLGFEDLNSLELYPQLSYDIYNRTATLERVYFVSSKAKFIKTWNYLNPIKDIKDKVILKKIMKTIPREFDEECPGLQFFANHNNLDIYGAKELLLKYSHTRESSKKLIVIENDANNYTQESLKYAVIIYDLGFLDKCGFFKVKKYQTFKELLPPNLIVELPIQLDINLREIPDKLKDEQMINLYKLK